jgi:hypothetical protein
MLEMHSTMENRLMVNNIDFSFSFCLDSEKIKTTYLHTHTLLAPTKNMYSNVVNPLHDLS